MFQPATKQPTGCVNSKSIYTLDFLRDNFGMGQHTLRTARRQGLKVRRIGRRGYVLGSDLIEFVEKIGA